MYSVKHLKDLVSGMAELNGYEVELVDDDVEMSIWGLNERTDIRAYHYLFFSKDNIGSTPIPIPDLVHEQDYDYYFYRALKKDDKWQVYEANSPHPIAGGAIFLSSKTVTLLDLPADKVEQWWVDQDGNLESYSHGKSELENHIHTPGDLYRNPGNESIHSMEILLESPDAYWGQDLYYNPLWPEHIQIRVYDRWLWVNKNDLEAHLPQELANEYKLIKNLS